MTLTTRLSFFFLATLALVLIGFSATLFLLAKLYLDRQAEERLDSALNTLVAAVEVGPDAVEWEPDQRHKSFGPSMLGNQVAWLISDDTGNILERSGPSEAGDFLEEAAELLRSHQQGAKRLTWQGDRWQIKQRWIEPAPSAAGTGPSPALSGNPAEHKYRALAITAGVPLGPLRAVLRNLAVLLIALSLGIWLLSLFVGRELCRRALAPLTSMAQSIQQIDVVDLEQRLPVPSSGDELEALNRSFNSLLNRLQESFERQQRFTGDASHQLRTPLATILGQIEVALRRVRPAEEYQRVLATVHEKADHLRKIVESLLFLTRADAEALIADRGPIELKEWLKNYRKSWNDHPRNSDISFEVESVDSAWINAHPVLLAELIHIFLDNAAKYSAPGAPITLRLARRENEIELTIEDRGLGISPDDQTRLFTPFFRAAQSLQRGIDGLGLGLSIAKRLADTFAASVEITSQLGQGSLIVLRFPPTRAPMREDDPAYLK